MFSVHFCISQNVLFTTAEVIKMSFAGMQGGIICGRVCIPRDAQGMHVLGGTESLCAFGFGWAEQDSGAFSEKLHFLYFPGTLRYKKLHPSEDRVPQQSLCVEGDILESKDQTTIIIAIKYNSIVES